METKKDVLKETENHSIDAMVYSSRYMLQEYIEDRLGISPGNTRRQKMNPVIFERIKKLTKQLIKTPISDIEGLIDLQQRIERLEGWDQELRAKATRKALKRSGERMKIAGKETSKAFKNFAKAFGSINVTINETDFNHKYK